MVTVTRPTRESPPVARTSRSVARAVAWIAFGLIAPGLRSGEAPKGNSRFYRVEQRGTLWWLIAPDRTPFFSMGVNVVDPGASRKTYSNNNPAYAAFQYYPDFPSWKTTTLSRLRQWNFNTLGAWSSEDLWRSAMPFTVELDLGSSAGAPYCDLFSPVVEEKFYEVARRKIPPWKDSSDLIGYFSDNELGWWSDVIFLHFLQHPELRFTHRVLLGVLRQQYGNDFSRLSEDFETGEARNYADLERPSHLRLRPGNHGMNAVDRFLFEFAERYYSLAYQAIRRYDPDHLILGDRYPQWYPASVARACGKFVDVVSSNLGADWADGSNARFFLETLHRLTGKPVLVSEFYFCARENRSGNRNSGGKFMTVQTQRERAAAFRKGVLETASLPFVVGAHWFQYYDEPANGRADAEDYNMGLVDIHDRPYEELTAVAASMDTAAIHRQAGATTPRCSSHPGPAVVAVPVAPRHLEPGLIGWDRSRALVPTESSLAFADLYAGWDPGHLYLALHAIEYPDPYLYGSRVPAREWMTWTVSSPSWKDPVRVHLGPGNAVTMEGRQLAHWERVSSTRITILISVPAALLGKRSLGAGDAASLEANLTSHRPSATVSWRATLHLTK